MDQIQALNQEFYKMKNKQALYKIYKAKLKKMSYYTI